MSTGSGPPSEAEAVSADLHRKVFGRRKGKPLRAHQRALVAAYLPRIAPLGVTPDENPARAPLDLTGLFGRSAPVWLEIGFGAGEHMIGLAQRHPDAGLLGAEPYVNGLASCLSHLETAGLDNIRIHHGDARDLLEVLPQASIARAYLLYPDPWPKARHVKRRFVNCEGMDLLARTLAPGALFHLATDIADYAEHSRSYMDTRSDFAEVSRDIREPWTGWIRTRYESKAIREGRAPHYLIWRCL